ncbi:unnamed protein product [Durusdinium trenchii]|uniref:Uncharacterized protein slr1851 n=2 Tax=Durusdinium trenchii TaxID=1381693 RepID=A0ABP0KAV4_9DINO
MALFSSKKPQPPSPKWAAAEVKTDFPESAKKAWKEGLSKPKEKFLERKEELTEWLGGEKKFDEIVKKIEDREECHWLERFYVSKDEDKPNACTRVCFKEQGDAIPAGRDKEFQDYLAFLLKVQDKVKNIQNAQQGQQFVKQWEASVLKLPNAQLQGANLVGAQLQGAILDGAQLQGAILAGAQLQGAILVGAQLQGADLTGAQLQGATLAKAQLQGAELGAQLQGADFSQAQLQGADLYGAQLQGANLSTANLTNTAFYGDFTGANLSTAVWERGEAPHCTDVTCEALNIPRFSKKPATRSGAMGALLAKLFRAFLPGGAEAEDSDEDGDDDETKTDEGESKEGEDGEDEGGDDQKDEDEGTSAPLLCNGACTGYCKAEAMETLQEVVIEVADESAEAAGRKLDEMMKKAEDQLGVALKHIDATMKPHVQALRQIMANNKFKKVFGKLAPEQQKALLGTITVLGKTEKGKTFAKGVKQFEDELKKLEGEGMSPFVTKLVDSQLQAATGYSSGELFAFLKVSPAQMASDMHELEDISGYVEKLQETVNVNNWDDIVENFLCLYDLQFRLKGERSRKVFATIWKDETLRKCVAVGRHFQHVTSLNDPPAFVLHMVKYASTIVKKGAVGWKLAMKKEMTAIDLMKSRQQAFFQFMISCITGFFVFVATFFSGLLLDAAKSGRVSIPYFSNFLISFNSTDAV